MSSSSFVSNQTITNHDAQKSRLPPESPTEMVKHQFWRCPKFLKIHILLQIHISALEHERLLATLLKGSYVEPLECSGCTRRLWKKELMVLMFNAFNLGR